MMIDVSEHHASIVRRPLSHALRSRVMTSQFAFCPSSIVIRHSSMRCSIDRTSVTPVASTRASRSRSSRALITATASHATSHATLVKICGITSTTDCALACEAGADFIGMIMSSKSKRRVTKEDAKAIASTAKTRGVNPVLVFVDEDARTIVEACDYVGCEYAQLHGDGARRALETLPMRVKAIYVLEASEDGRVMTKLPGDEEKLIAQRREAMSGEQGWRAAVDFVNGPRRVVDYLLIDGVRAGSGVAFNWRNLKPPRGASRKGWFLAGGLTPENVAEAIDAAHPTGVDVASGVADASGVAKDEGKMKAFATNAKATKA